MLSGCSMGVWADVEDQLSRGHLKGTSARGPWKACDSGQRMAIASPLFICVPDVGLFTPSGMGVVARSLSDDRVLVT